MQENTNNGLWFSPDYAPDMPSSPQSNLHLTPRMPQPFEPSPTTQPSQMDEKSIKIMIWGNSSKEAIHIYEELQKTGYENLSYATTYEDGLELIQSTLFDFFIIDLSLDGIGTKLVQALRSSTTYKYTPMLICTESQQIPDMLNAMKAGANDLICKPIHAGLLSKKIMLHSRMVEAA